MAVNRGVWREDLKCSVLGIDYSFVSKVGVLILPPLCCTDMTGAIEFFRAIDKDVTLIRTIAGDEPDVVYVRKSHGRWVAKDPNVKHGGA